MELIKVSGGKFVFGEFGLTRMAGSESEMTLELKFLDILKNNKSVKLSGDTLNFNIYWGNRISF